MNTQTFDQLAGEATVQKVEKALGEHNFQAESVATGADAFNRIKELIPKGASVMNGSSVTLEKIGFVDYLKSGEHGWNNLHEAVLKETDKEKQGLLRRQSVVSDYYLGSAHAITLDGQIVVSSNSGSQLPHLAYTSPNVILVVSTKKIVPTLQDAFDRINIHILPLEEVHMQQKYGIHTNRSKTLILHSENPMFGRSVRVIFVEEDLGF